MSLLVSALEAILFSTQKPFTLRQLQRVLQVSEEEVQQALVSLRDKLNTEDSGIHLLEHQHAYTLVTNPAYAAYVERCTEDRAGNLTRPALETLTVIAYRGPLTRHEIEAIRGVQCALILLNLLVRGLIEEKNHPTKEDPVYTLSDDTLRYLGVHSEKELPDYETFHGDARISQLVDALDGV